MSRRTYAVLFALGALSALAFGALLASYDLWGGIPRSLWPIARWLLSGGVVLMAAGAVGWVTTWPRADRTRAVLRAVVVLAGLAALGGGALWFHYISRWETSRRICAPAVIATTRTERERALRDGLGPLFPIIDPNYACLELERERRDLAEHGTCPTFMMDDAPCTCGREPWTSGSTARCKDGPTTCEYRGAETGLAIGCAGDEGKRMIEEAKRYGGR